MKSPTRSISRGKRKALAFSIAIAVGALGLSACAPASDGGTTDEPGSMEGAQILVVPYWLDNFNTAYTSWLTRYLNEMGAETTVINANAVASRQLDSINSAINTGQYDGIVWAPIDLGAAATTVKLIQDAGIPQVVFGAVLDPNEIQVPQVNLDEANSLTAAGEIAATYIAAHPELGDKPLAAFMGVYPQNETCVVRKDSFLRGMQSVTPDAEVVFFGSAQDAADATTKMTNFITTNTPFNVTIGCGSASTLGTLAALKAAGLGGAVNKVPEHVFAMTQDGSPPELEDLWDENSALMASMLLPPKDGARQTAELIAKVITGELPLDATDEVSFGWSPLSPDCEASRAIVLDEFDGVEGFDVPECSFEYQGD